MSEFDHGHGPLTQNFFSYFAITLSPPSGTILDQITGLVCFFYLSVCPSVRYGLLTQHL